MSASRVEHFEHGVGKQELKPRGSRRARPMPSHRGMREMSFLSDLAHLGVRQQVRMQTTGDGNERNLRSPSPRFEFVIAVFALIALLLY